MTTLSRRNLLSARWRKPASAQRPPWTIPEPAFIAGCTRCHSCIEQCETGVLIAGDGGFPAIDFHRAECTFCHRCADACELPLFELERTQPWKIQAEIQTNCLTQKGIECRSCQDACEPYAIRFAPHLSGIAKPTVDLDKCTGCGECVRGCPVDAIRITPAARPEMRDAVARNEV